MEERDIQIRQMMGNAGLDFSKKDKMKQIQAVL